MSTRVLDSTHASLEAVMRKLPKKGASSVYVLSVVSRIDWLVRRCKTLITRAQCLSNARGSCSSGKDFKVCDSKCSSIMVVEGAGEIAVYKKTGSPITVKVSPNGLEIATRDHRVVVSGTLLKLEIPTPTGSRMEKEIKLDDVNEISENDYIIKQSLKGLETKIEVMLKNLATCARETATVCP